MSGKKGAPLLRVRWIDSCSPCGWTDRASLEGGYSPSEIESVGWLVVEDKQSLTLAGSTSPHQFHGVMCIPKVAITSRKTIKGERAA